MNKGCPGSEGFESLPRQVKCHPITIDPNEAEVRKSFKGECRMPAKPKSRINEDRSRLLDRGSQDREDALPHDRYVTFDGGHGSVQLQMRTRIATVTMVPPVKASEASRTARSRTACLVAREGAVMMAMVHLLFVSGRAIADDAESIHEVIVLPNACLFMSCWPGGRV